MKIDKRFCAECGREIFWVADFFFDPSFSPHPFHVACHNYVQKLGVKDEERRIRTQPHGLGRRRRFVTPPLPG